MANSAKKELKSEQSPKHKSEKGEPASVDAKLITENLEEHLEKTLSFDLDSVFERELKNLDFS